MTLHIPNFHTMSFDETTRQGVFGRGEEARQLMIRHLLYPYNRFLDLQDSISQWHRPMGSNGIAEVGELGLLLGDSGNGKSDMMKSFYRNTVVPPDGDRMRFPVIYIEVLSGWKAGAFATALLKATGRKLSSKRVNADQLGESAVERLMEYETSFIIVDDAHFLFHQKRYYDENYSLLKSIVDKQFANVLLCGIPHLQDIVMADFQLGRRTGFRADLPKFDAATEGKLYQAFLFGVDERLPFQKESGLSKPAMVERLHHASGGSVGITMTIIKRAARLALTAKSACLMEHHVRLAIEQVLLANRDALAFEED